MYQNCIEKVHWSGAYFLPPEIASNNVRQNDFNFSFIKITLKEARQYDVELSPIEFSSKKYVEMKKKFIEILFLTYWHNIDIALMSIGYYISVE